MLQTITCHSCGTTGLLPSGPAAAKPRCGACGAFYRIKALEKQVCKSCGQDLSVMRKVKQPDGSLLCQRCADASAEPVARPAQPPPRWTEPSPAPAAVRVATAAAVVYYPCEVCERLFTADEVLTEADGETICKPCWQARGGGETLPEGLELAAAPDSARSATNTFCESCRRFFPVDKLQLTAENKVLCKDCMIRQRLQHANSARQAERLAEMQKVGGKRPARKTPWGQIAIAVLAALAGIGLLLYSLRAAGLLPTSSPHHVAHPPPTGAKK